MPYAKLPSLYIISPILRLLACTTTMSRRLQTGDWLLCDAAESFGSILLESIKVVHSKGSAKQSPNCKEGLGHLRNPGLFVEHLWNGAWWTPGGPLVTWSLRNANTNPNKNPDTFTELCRRSFG